MWPLDSAKIDSVWASSRGASSRSRTAHGSTANTSAPIMARSSSSARSFTTTSAPCSRSAVGVPDAVDPDHPAEVSRAPRLRRPPARPRTPPPGRVRHRAPGRRPGTCPAPACRRGARARRRRRRSDLEQVLDAGRHRARPGSSRSTRPPPGAAPRRAPPRRTGPSPRTARRRRRGSASARSRSCALPEPVDRLGVGGVVGRALGSSMPRDSRNERTPSRRGLPSTYSRSPRAARTPGTARRPVRPLAQVLVEHLLPRLGVDLGGLGQDPVEVEQAGRDPVGQAEHGRKLAASSGVQASGVRELALRTRRRAGVPALALGADVVLGDVAAGEDRVPSSASSSACSPGPWVTRKSGPSLAARSPTEVLSSITTSDSPGKPASTSLSSPSTDAASAVASSRRRSALGRAAGGPPAPRPRPPPRRWARKGSICWTMMHVLSRSL